MLDRYIAALLLLHVAEPFPTPALSAIQDSSAAFSATRPQSIDEATRPPLSAALSRLDRDKKIRVELSSLGRFEGRFVRISDDVLYMGVEQKLETQSLIVQVTFPADSIHSMWVGQDMKGAGAVIGGVVGLALGLVWASAQDVECTGNAEDIASCLGEEFALTTTAIIGRVFLGVAVGSIAGLAIGSAFTHWEAIYP